MIYLFIFLKCNVLLTFSRFSQCCQKIALVRGFGRVYKQSSPKCPCPSLNCKFVVPPRFLFTTQHASTNYYGVTVISHMQPSPVSNLTTHHRLILTATMMTTHSLFQTL